MHVVYWDGRVCNLDHQYIPSLGLHILVGFNRRELTSVEAKRGSNNALNIQNTRSSSPIGGGLAVSVCPINSRRRALHSGKLVLAQLLYTRRRGLDDDS